MMENHEGYGQVEGQQRVGVRQVGGWGVARRRGCLHTCTGTSLVTSVAGGGTAASAILVVFLAAKFKIFMVFQRQKSLLIRLILET